MQKSGQEDEELDVSDEVVDDVEDEIKRQPCDSDVTFGFIPKKVSRSHFSVDQTKIAVVKNLKKQWKQLSLVDTTANGNDSAAYYEEQKSVPTTTKAKL